MPSTAELRATIFWLSAKTRGGRVSVPLVNARVNIDRIPRFQPYIIEQMFI